MALQPIDIKKAKHRLTTKAYVGRRAAIKQQDQVNKSEEIASNKRWESWTYPGCRPKKRWDK